MKYRIYDWAGNCTLDKDFKTFDEAEEFLAEHLGCEYQEARGEYEIKEKRI